jgi:hypothetical protein
VVMKYNRSALYICIATFVIAISSSQASARQAHASYQQARQYAYQGDVFSSQATRRAYPSRYQVAWVQHPRVFTRADIEGIRVLERMR